MNKTKFVGQPPNPYSVLLSVPSILLTETIVPRVEVHAGKYFYILPDRGCM